MKKIIINGNVFDGVLFSKQTIVIENNFIKNILPENDTSLESLPILYDAKGAKILPGFIDVHVHFNDPGRQEWESFPTGSSAAAAGGITTVFDMPLNSHPSANNASVLLDKKQALENRSYTNYGLWAGMTADVAGDTAALDAMVSTGIVGFKGFLSESGIDDFKRLDRQALSCAMKYCGQTGAVLALHAEWEDTIKQSMQTFSQADRNDVRAFLDSRPIEAEMKAVELAMEDAAKYGTKVHIVHVSHPKVVELIQQAKNTGVDVSLETCPHYLVFNEEDFLQQGPLLKCAPPLRNSDCVDGLWEQVKNKQIDFICSDHSPCPLSMKQTGNENIWEAWGGIQGVQFGTTAFLSEAMIRGFSLEDVLPLLTANVATRFPSLEKQGVIRIGNQANFTIYHSDTQTIIKEEDILFRHPYSPYVGREVQGNVEATIVNGNLVFDREKGIISDPIGKNICAL